MKTELAIVGKRLQGEAQERTVMVLTIDMGLAVGKTMGVNGIVVVRKQVDELFGSSSEEQQDSQVSRHRYMQYPFQQ